MSVSRRERKVVTVLFADLVGFTSRAETLDPEDVEAILGPYHERLRSELERFGGTVEKFIGDAVMALFGAPVAHEDDPERAVRAALAIRDWARDEENVQVRIAVNTGEALVNLEARPESGQGMAAGDVVNTTARLQSAAPINGILVGETTYRATRGVIDYDDAPPVEAKGKSEPIPVWEVRDARAQVRTEAVSTATPLVGRDREVALLRDTLIRVREESAPQIVTIIGVPGIGKSRLVHELFAFVEQSGVLTYWRQGRSLPYGQGVSFWALSEIVKAQAGILETDDDSEVDGKLRSAVANLVSGEREQTHLVQYLRPLVGIEGEAVTSQTQALAAWRQLFEAMAEQHPLVLVFEDIQWSDDGLLDFIDHLIDWSGRLPILIVCTARPELLERRPGWGGGKLNATTLSISPLSETDTARLLSELLATPVLESTQQQELLARAGGNPLYAEQFAQMLAEQRTGDEVPETIHGIIAARLDRLADEEKSLVQDAAVFGKIFWLGALANGRARDDVERLLHSLERKGFVQRARRTSVSDEPEYAFLHVLVRDVAYGQIPRGDRAAKHLRAAEWIDALGRTDDHAELLAHHYVNAVELARAAGADISAAHAAARDACRAGGDRAMSLSAFATAARLYWHALDLTDGDERADVLFQLGRALSAARDGRGHDVLAEAHDALLASGDVDRAAETDAIQAEAYWIEGQLDRANEHLRRAEETTRGRSASPSKARILSEASRFHMVGGRPDEAIRVGSEAIAIAEDLGLDEIHANALVSVGSAQQARGDPAGDVRLKEALELAERLNLPQVSWRARNNLAGTLMNSHGDTRGAARLYEHALREAERFGDGPQADWFRALLGGTLYLLGDFDDAYALVEAALESDAHYQVLPSHTVRARIRIARDDDAGAAADAERAIEIARHDGDPQLIAPQLAAVALVLNDLGRRDDAAPLIVEALELARSADAVAHVTPFYLTAAIASVALGLTSAYLDGTANADERLPWIAAGRAYARADADALERVDRLSMPDAAWVRLRHAGSDADVESALSFWRSVGAKRYIREAEALLRKSA